MRDIAAFQRRSPGLFLIAVFPALSFKFQTTGWRLENPIGTLVAFCIDGIAKVEEHPAVIAAPFQNLSASTMASASQEPQGIEETEHHALELAAPPLQATA